jgi:hypothetical protein
MCVFNFFVFRCFRASKPTSLHAVENVHERRFILHGFTTAHRVAVGSVAASVRAATSGHALIRVLPHSAQTLRRGGTRASTAANVQRVAIAVAGNGEVARRRRKLISLRGRLSGRRPILVARNQTFAANHDRLTLALATSIAQQSVAGLRHETSGGASGTTDPIVGCSNAFAINERKHALDDATNISQIAVQVENNQQNHDRSNQHGKKKTARRRSQLAVLLGRVKEITNFNFRRHLKI